MDPTDHYEKWLRCCSGQLKEAAEEARRMQDSHLGVEHLFISLARATGGTTECLLRQLGIDPGQARDALRRESGKGKGTFSAFPLLTPRLLSVLNRAAERGARTTLTDRDLLIATFHEGESLPVRYLASLGHTPQSMLRCLCAGPPEDSAEQTRLAAAAQDADGTRLCADAASPPSGAPLRPPSPPAPALDSAAQAGPPIVPKTDVPVSYPTPTLDQYGRDLSKLARLGKLVDAIGRESEIEQIITILARTQKSNPLLLGEAGVGKTAIIEGLAWRIEQGLIPLVLKGKRLVEMEMGSLTAGTQYRGQFEERITQIVKEASQAPEVILFIDEIHTIVGAGSGQGANDAAQMLKPALARGDISCIGATTQDEFSRYLRKDPALERRFSPVTIQELTPEATLAVLQKVAPRILEKQARAGQTLQITPDALWAAVTLTDKYVKDRHQPDKGIDAIDIACARAVVKGQSLVGADEVALVVSDWTGIPAGRLSADEQQRYRKMEEFLNQRVVGQAEAVSAICRSVRAALAGMKQANRPVGVFLFMGPSGVGKTKLAKELARFLFETPEALLRFDMNEYQEKQSLSNLIGSARGYVGSEQGGQFTESLRRRPYSVVLLDEIEKAHPDIFNVFLSVFDDGRITDNQGRVVDCANAVFVLTSNLGLSRIGYLGRDEDLRSVAMQFLRPELVNRITEVVRFLPLGAKEFGLILEQVLAERTEGFRKNQQITLRLDEAAKTRILASDIDPRMGARPLERAVDQHLVQPLVDAIFAGQILPNSDVLASVQGDKFVFTSMPREEPL